MLRSVNHRKVAKGGGGRDCSGPLSGVYNPGSHPSPYPTLSVSSCPRDRTFSLLDILTFQVELLTLVFLVHACVSHVCVSSRVRLCDPVDCSPPGSSVYGILQARILEWVAMPSSRESSQPRDGRPCHCLERKIVFFCFTET